jgi:hypothetical protein
VAPHPVKRARTSGFCFYKDQEPVAVEECRSATARIKNEPPQRSELASVPDSG